MLNNRTLQGFLAIGPLVLGILVLIAYLYFFFSMFSDIERMEQNPENFPTEFMTNMGIIMVAFFLAIILSFSSLIYFVIHAAKNPNLEQNNMRVVWILIIVLVGGIGNLIYWIAEIASKNPKPIIK